MDNQEKLDCETLLRFAAKNIFVNYELYIDENENPTFQFESSDGVEYENFSITDLPTIEISKNMKWLLGRLHPKAQDVELMRAWLRQYDIWSKE